MRLSVPRDEIFVHYFSGSVFDFFPSGWKVHVEVEVLGRLSHLRRRRKEKEKREGEENDEERRWMKESSKGYTYIIIAILYIMNFVYISNFSNQELVAILSPPCWQHASCLHPLPFFTLHPSRLFKKEKTYITCEMVRFASVLKACFSPRMTGW